MCLLAVFHKAIPGFPLVVAANRDEFFERPATVMTVLQETGPRILGGRDERAGGTWLASNEHGVVAGLTNRPGGTLAGRRSRGELPLLLAREPSARAATSRLEDGVCCEDYSPAWLLVGDGRDLFYLDMTSVISGRPLVRELPAGLHVLENAPLEEQTGKSRRVRARLELLGHKEEAALVAALAEALSDHHMGDEAGGDQRPPPFLATCVHAGPYGTRSAQIVLLAAGGGPPRIWYADGPPCRAGFREPPAGWSRGPAGA